MGNGTTIGTSMKKELLGLSDWAWGRTRLRLEGLTDQELFWEPYPGCWTVRQLKDGTWVSDWMGADAGVGGWTGQQPPDIPPLTTIAWRVVHLIGCYGGGRNSEWLGASPGTEPVESWGPLPVTAREAVVGLERGHHRWRRILESLDDAALGERLGPIAGEYALEAKAAFVNHILDEVIHHGAEIALMRDLYRAASGEIHAIPVVARLMKGDLGAFEEAAGDDALVGRLADVGRWDLVEEALSRGFAPDGPAPTALHRAAALGLAGLVDQLLAAGADPTARDPRFGASPGGWAAFFGHRELARRLEPS